MTQTPPETEKTTAWSQDHRTPDPDPTLGESPRGAWAAGGTLFAGVLMLVSGCLGVLNGIAAIAKDDVYSRIGDYVYAFDLTTWGWIHLVIGALVAVTGWGVLKGQDWARGAGIALGALYVVEYFLFLPYAPVWSLISIAIGVFVIWALATDHGRAPNPGAAKPA
ncbi:hypothetical protein OG785_18905 [Streptomyces sp. NBC_00006]|uniref:DUF7144 family membrane protein n=1 Tax=unclassified Streptomyces TaxID=2593676 RepID=UPI00225C063E|nr:MULTISPECIES: hypothetical protein [unclassified Streptomyces]MCX5532621.1 hypothetical protein [Streptomyces sp. NBC_00006]